MKNKKFIRILSLLLALFLGFQSSGMVAYGAETPKFTEFSLSQFEVQNGKWENAPTGNSNLSYKPGAKFDVSFVGETDATNSLVRGTLPASYSSSSYVPAYTSSNNMSFDVKKDIVTPIKNQYNGTCWAHAAMSVAESSYIKDYGIKSNAIDFNEYHHTWYAYSLVNDKLGLFGGDRNIKADGVLSDGGNNQISLLMLASWTGASNASESVFDGYDIDNGNTPKDSFAYDDYAHLENGYILPMTNADYYYSDADMKTDMDIVKQAIMDYGSVTLAYYANPGYTYEANGYQCINIEGFLDYYGINHSVTVVGWNDNVPASAFPNGADGNGAWLVKNSWGTSYGFDGYFWLSYYDRSILTQSIAFDFAKSNNYDNNYQYDGGGGISTGVQYSGYDYIYAGNAFVADSSETVEAVGLYTYQNNVDYTIYVYTDLGANDAPADGTLAHTQSGSVTFTGYHTVDLTKSIPVDAKERYAIVVKFEKPGYQMGVQCDQTSYDWGWVEFYSYAKKGQSYCGLSLAGMTDMNASNTSYADGYNVRIKSFTNEADGIVKKGSDGNWYYYRGGKIDKTYFGIAPNAKGVYYYVKNGKVNFNINGIAKCGSTAEDFYNFKNGKLVETTTIAKNSSNGNWYYVVNGKVNFKYTGVAQKSSGVWYYVAKGKVDFTFNGVAPNAKGALYYVNKGKVDFEKTGIHKRAGVYYYFKNGKVQETDTIIKHTNGNWYAVFDGIVDFTYDGIASNGKNTYYIENGKVDFTKAGIHKRSGNFYYFKAGKVQFIDSIVKNDANGNWYAIFDGVVDFTFEGIASNDRGMYYCQKGKVNFNYTGTVEYEGKTYNVVKGKATLVE